MTPKSYVAIHEAAHAVVSNVLGAPMESVTIQADVDAGNLGNAVNVHGDPYSDIYGEDWNLLVRAVSMYARHMATVKLGHDEDFEEAGAASDYRDALFALDSMTAIEDLQRRAMDMSKLVVETCWDTIRMVAEVLEERGTLTAPDLDNVLRECAQ